MVNQLYADTEIQIARKKNFGNTELSLEDLSCESKFLECTIAYACNGVVRIRIRPMKSKALCFSKISVNCLSII